CRPIKAVASHRTPKLTHAHPGYSPPLPPTLSQRDTGGNKMSRRCPWWEKTSRKWCSESTLRI
ncbi:MAG: hypothetical protein ACUVQH_15140, partial [Thermogutta sp.]